MWLVVASAIPSWNAGQLPADESGGATTVKRGQRRIVWALVVLFFVGGDALTTGAGLATPGIIERNPAIEAVLEAHGFAAVVAIKIVVIGAAFVIARSLPTPQDFVVPLGFAIVGVIVTGWNLGVLSAIVLF